MNSPRSRSGQPPVASLPAVALAKAGAKGGFSLVELLMAMAIVGILAGLVIVAINPTKQMADARNTQRKFDVNTLLNAFGQYSVDSGGFFQPRRVDGIPLIAGCAVNTSPKKLCKPTTLHGSGSGMCGDATIQCAFSRHLTGAYIAGVPHDPWDAEDSAADLATVDYYVSSNAPGRFRVDAENAESEIDIGAIR